MISEIRRGGRYILSYNLLRKKVIVLIYIFNDNLFLIVSICLILLIVCKKINIFGIIYE
jgi:hypothetical protein